MVAMVVVMVIIMVMAVAVVVPAMVITIMLVAMTVMVTMVMIGSVDNDGRMWIRPGPQNMFDPPILPTRDIIRIIKSKFEDCWENYAEVKKNRQDLADLWYGEFKRKYKWLPERERQIRKSFDHKTSNGYSNAMYRVRKKIDSDNWIPNEMRQ
ncbi:TdcA1-ORF1-ORF2 protein [Spatholobus suberectus]|nr:TdcA1-ORF1-ORF2 protein [Spatholobus suberectus]